jgi:REP element-mobilizing transposase RayT
MSRKTLVRSTHFPYHITARANNKEPFHLCLGSAWKVFNDQLFEMSILFGIQIHAFVLMPNHFHLLITTPNEDLGLVMQNLMRSITRALNLKSGRSGRVFGARYHWTLINSHVYFSHAYKYVYRNPVKADLSKNVEDYPFSTLNGLLGFQSLYFPLYFPFGEDRFAFIPDTVQEQLTWLNKPFKKEHDQGINKLLKKTVFSPPMRGWKGALKELENQLI